MDWTSAAVGRAGGRTGGHSWELASLLPGTRVLVARRETLPGQTHQRESGGWRNGSRRIVDHSITLPLCGKQAPGLKPTAPPCSPTPHAPATTYTLHTRILHCSAQHTRGTTTKQLGVSIAERRSGKYQAGRWMGVNKHRTTGFLPQQHCLFENLSAKKDGDKRDSRKRGGVARDVTILAFPINMRRKDVGRHTVKCGGQGKPVGPNSQDGPPPSHAITHHYTAHHTHTLHGSHFVPDSTPLDGPTQDRQTSLQQHQNEQK